MINNSATVVQLQLCPRYWKEMPALESVYAIESIGLRRMLARAVERGITSRSDSIQLG